MRYLLILIVLLMEAAAFAASVTVTDSSCTSPVNLVVTCGTAPTPPTPPVPPVPPTPPSGLTCDMSKTRLQANAQMQPIKAGQAVALAFVASGYAHPAVQYNNVSAAVSVSATPCDFAPAQWQCVGVSTVGPGVFTSTSDARYCLLTEGAQYYMNVRMATRDASGALVEACVPGSVSDYFGPGCQFMPF